MNTQSISRILAAFIHNLSFADLPDEVVERAKNRILDALATAIAGRDSPHYKMGLELVKNNKGNATVFTHSLKLPAIDAAFINAILIDNIGQTDSMVHAHPGGPIVSTAISVAEQEGSSGTEVITAVVAGYDIMGRIGSAAPSITPRFRGLSVYGPFGAAATAGKLLRLNEDQLTSALGYTANFASGLCECWVAGTPEGKFHAGLASRNGIMAANLAKAGATAAETSLEGKSGFYQAFAGTTEGIDTAVTDLGKRFLIMEAEYKPYPICAHNQISVDLALSLVKQHAIKAKDIEKVSEKIPYYSFTFPGLNYVGPFSSRFQAAGSNQFSVAAALIGKPVFSPQFYNSDYNAPDVAILAKKVELTGIKDSDTVQIVITLKNGMQYSAESNGSALLMPATGKVKLKFEYLTSDFLDRSRIDRIINIVLSLEKVGQISELTRELSG